MAAAHRSQRVFHVGKHGVADVIGVDRTRLARRPRMRQVRHDGVRTEAPSASGGLQGSGLRIAG